jgi:carboxyl-terminal processing protease
VKDWVPSVRAIAVLAAVVLVAAVTTLVLSAGPPSPAPVAAPADEEPADDPTPPDSRAEVTAEIVGCEDPPGTFAPLCEVHSLLHENYVDPVDDEALAGAASDALRTLARQDDLERGEREDGALPCAAPTAEFEDVCGLYAEVLGETGAGEGEVVEGLLLGMVEGLEDPNSAYLPPRINELLREDMGGQVEGIGALVTTRDADDPDEPCRTISETCHLVVVSPIEGGPADAAGIRPDDRIISFDGTPVSGETIHEAVARGRGPAGTEVAVEVERESQRFEVTIERRAVDVPQVEGEMLEGDVGYLRIIRFAEGGDEEFRRHLNELLEDGAERFVLDLRNNPGGLTGPTSDIADEFLGPGVVFSLEGADGPIDRWTATTGGAAVDRDVVVLINRATVSAAEILAAALSQQGGATLVGETTAGKGTAQRSFEVSGGGAVRITVARWLTPDGSSVEGDGVAPDIEIEDAIGPEEDSDEDPVLRRAVEHLLGDGSG